MRRRLGSDFYLHALPPVHRGNSLLYDYLTGHTCGKGQVRVYARVCVSILAKFSTICSIIVQLYFPLVMCCIVENICFLNKFADFSNYSNLLLYRNGKDFEAMKKGNSSMITS